MQGIPPIEVDKFNRDTDPEELAKQLNQRSSDSTTRSIIRNNYKANIIVSSLPYREELIARKIQVKLENYFRGSGTIILYNAISNWYNIKYNDYTNLSKFTIAFSKNIN